jgi:hypothetical protein
MQAVGTSLHEEKAMADHSKDRKRENDAAERERIARRR